MRSTRPYPERIQELQDLKSRIQEKERLLKKRYSEQQRKERTHRLIQIGAIVEKHAGGITDLDAFNDYIFKNADTIRAMQKVPVEESIEGILDELQTYVDEVNNNEEIKPINDRF